MSKDVFYFTHDCNARNDEKILALRMKWGWEGYGLFWALIEKLRESTDYTSVRDYNIIAYDLRTKSEIVKSIINDFGLFTFTEDGKRFYSERLNKTMNIKNQKSEQAREKVLKRWKNQEKEAENTEPQTQNLYHSNTDVIPQYYHSNTNKEKESKVNNVLLEKEPKEKKIPKKSFSPPSLDEVLAYATELNATDQAEHFWDYYQSNGWKVSKNPMKDWKSAFRNWVRNKQKFNNEQANHNDKPTEKRNPYGGRASVEVLRQNATGWDF